jgi:hypothetical protein
MTISMNNLLLTADELPDWFTYPKEAVKLVEKNILDLQPWEIVTGDRLRGFYNSPQIKKLNLVPFALRTDTDDFVGWSRKHQGQLVRYDWLSLGFPPDQIYVDVWEWFRSAINEFIAFE